MFSKYVLPSSICKWASICSNAINSSLLSNITHTFDKSHRGQYLQNSKTTRMQRQLFSSARVTLPKLALCAFLGLQFGNLI
jgi:hypothetical protein